MMVEASRDNLAQVVRSSWAADSPPSAAASEAAAGMKNLRCARATPEPRDLIPACLDQDHSFRAAGSPMPPPLTLQGRGAQIHPGEPDASAQKVVRWTRPGQRTKKRTGMPLLR